MKSSVHEDGFCVFRHFLADKVEIYMKHRQVKRLVLSQRISTFLFINCMSIAMILETLAYLACKYFMLRIQISELIRLCKAIGCLTIA